MLRSGRILPLSHHFIVNSVQMTSGTSAGQLEVVVCVGSTHVSTVELTNL